MEKCDETEGLISRITTEEIRKQHEKAIGQTTYLLWLVVEMEILSGNSDE